MKKLFVTSLLAVSLLAACQDEQPKEPTNSVQQEPKQTEAKNEQKHYTGLQLVVEPVLNEEDLTLNILLENTSKEEIPFYLNDTNLIKLSVETDKGTVLVEEWIEEKKRKSIHPKEKLNWEMTFKLNERSSMFNIKAELLFNDQEKETYAKEELKKKIEIKGNKATFTYLPNDKKKYIYDELVNGKEVVEDYLYFKDNFVQSNNTAEGTKVYMQDDSGVHLVYVNDYNQFDGNVIDQIEPDKKTLLKYPIEVGTMWKVDDVIYEITQTDAVVETPYYDFDHVVVVTLSNGTKMYYHESVGLIQLDSQDTTVLRLQDIR